MWPQNTRSVQTTWVYLHKEPCTNLGLLVAPWSLYSEVNEIHCGAANIRKETVCKIWKGSSQSCKRYKLVRSCQVSLKFSSSFHTLTITAIKLERAIRLPENVTHLRRDIECTLVLNLIQNLWMSYKRLFTKNGINMLSRLKGKQHYAMKLKISMCMWIVHASNLKPW